MVHPPKALPKLHYPGMPAPQKLRLSDAELVQALADGKSRTRIAQENGVNAECVRWRLRQLSKNLPAPAARRADDTVTLTLSAMDAMRANIRLLHELRDSCAKHLQGTDGTLDVGPHDFDLEVLVSSAGEPPTRRTLKSLLSPLSAEALKIETRGMDPRQLLLATLTQIRQHVELGVRLVERIHDAQELALFQEEVLKAIEAAEPETAARIRGALQQRRELRLALEPPPD